MAAIVLSTNAIIGRIFIGNDAAGSGDVIADKALESVASDICDWLGPNATTTLYNGHNGLLIGATATCSGPCSGASCAARFSHISIVRTCTPAISASCAHTMPDC